ncbi:hypothetical protein PHAMO_130003 [Magnetospirillum molischianum DSM 120]|uniref:Uncharacterized protein n=1 Tax=Magnetospirillum molischianum DSM 120 TaxID=1150626 RepID=H8FNJ5_MAGML|nr:hypothetical protein PHAMO_130003 [Magnetospirillum molischianum DSM 120]
MTKDPTLILKTAAADPVLGSAVVQAVYTATGKVALRRRLRISPCFYKENFKSLKISFVFTKKILNH